MARNQTGKFPHFFRQCIRRFLIVCGIMALLMIFLAFTSGPFWAWYGLGAKRAGINRPPAFIVVLGGGGMPSESGLMRCWYGAKAANHFTRSKVIVALPGDLRDTLSSVSLMRKELMIRGVSGDRIMAEDSGTNTRAEALQVRKIVNGFLREVNGHRKANILIVTSPEHLWRAVRTFEKAGFRKVDGLPAFEKALEADLVFKGKKLGGRYWMPDVGRNITLRYEFWRQLGYEILVLRELTAMGYYWVMGWV